MVEMTMRYPALVRVAHWLTVASFFALLVSGAAILLAHPRFYWGETGNVHMTPAFQFDIPSTRNTVPTGYAYVLPDADGWGRSLHFEAAWLVVVVGLVYLVSGLRDGRLRTLFAGLSPGSLAASTADHLSFRSRTGETNALQRATYATVIFVLFPLIIWTGLAMSPALNGLFPPLARIVGGHQSARTIHFFIAVALVMFLLIHLFMISISGFRNRMRSMITGRYDPRESSV